MEDYSSREQKYGKIYGERCILAIILHALWCSWRDHRYRKDFKNNLRCEVCFYSEVDHE